MLYNRVSCGTGHSFRGTRTIPYPHWGSECQIERAPALEESGCWICVLDRTGREREWMKEFEGGRRPTKGRSGANGEMSRQTTQESE